MSFDAKVLRVMIASPGDVQDERRIATEVINEWNGIHAGNRGIVLLPVKWETHTTPQMGAPPQVLVNKQILDDADILIGIFGIRLGTPTTSYTSGTVEEITLHADRQKTVKLYFSNAPLPRGYDQAQYAALEIFRKECQQKGLYHPYDSIVEFEKDFRRHLELELNDPLYRTATVAQVPTNVRPVAGLPDLTEEAAEMLKDAVASGGDILVSDRIGRNYISAGGKLYGDKELSPKSLAIWKTALSQLEKLGYVESVSQSIRRVTGSGYRVDELLSGDVIPTEERAIPRLSNDAQTLLVAASLDEHGSVLETEMNGLYDLISNGQGYVTNRSARERARWKAALDELQKENLFSEKEGDIYRISSRGFDVVARIAQQDVKGLQEIL
ncbi:DUF4062 domain-containing protein [Tunturiibacter gelidoferens]|uniref:DUF4062 domain-containing protein n=1 Tax=Tunturiibacter gelidiferens TaxID=3069689 RepID=A0A9X0QFF6_9BACT|nr:DUF4062 domain-containing protein [Edaphobacter lichenicola]MBB5329442.1 hypothetical protein [Edaphobacter lichenicola]